LTDRMPCRGIILFMAALLLLGCHSLQAAAADGREGDHGQLRAYFLDVGQGDATLLTGPDFTILIDAGRHDRNDVVAQVLRISMDGKGRWMDNVFIERLWRSLKYECVDLHAPETGCETRAAVRTWNRLLQHRASARDV